MRNHLKQFIKKSRDVKSQRTIFKPNTKDKYKNPAPIIEYISNNEINDIKRLEKRINSSSKLNRTLKYKLVDGKMIKQF